MRWRCRPFGLASPPSTRGWQSRAQHPSKPCRTTSALAGRAYASAGQASAALHTMAVLQVFQARLLRSLDESVPDSEVLKDLRSATDLALRATKATAQAIGKNMANLTVLERHLWLNLTEMKDADKASFLDAPISTTGLFGPSVVGFAERFTEAQKASQAMRHFLPKRSSSSSGQGRSRGRPPPSQPAKPAAPPSRPRSSSGPRQRSRSANRSSRPERRRPRPRLVSNPEPPKPS
ncbi:uncharacterized protein [Pseudorasbora parva]|uniref:uncharacterized protein n=1 Tax=Pseudorasbora parva TaxID=51549 RepID=UPI00351E2177